MTYKVYQITSPSSRSYIGFTSQSVQTRWVQHSGEARRGKKHPFHAAIRKYGAANFKVKTLSEHSTQQEAFEKEIQVIATIPRAYNVSPGGGNDCFAGRDRLRELRKDLVWDAAYKKKISEGCKESEKYKAVLPGKIKKLIAWRKSHPREVNRQQRRITRIAAKKAKGKKPWNFGKKHSGVSKLKMGASQRKRIDNLTAAQIKKATIAKRKGITKMWRDRTPEQVREVADKIRKSIKYFYENRSAEEKEKHYKQLMRARKNIDHDLRKKRQKEALGMYWTPERRAAKAVEVETGENYANVRHNRFRSKK